MTLPIFSVIFFESLETEVISILIFLSNFAYVDLIITHGRVIVNRNSEISKNIFNNLFASD